MIGIQYSDESSGLQILTPILIYASDLFIVQNFFPGSQVVHVEPPVVYVQIVWLAHHQQAQRAAVHVLRPSARLTKFLVCQRSRTKVMTRLGYRSNASRHQPWCFYLLATGVEIILSISESQDKGLERLKGHAFSLPWSLEVGTKTNKTVGQRSEQRPGSKRPP